MLPFLLKRARTCTMDFLFEKCSHPSSEPSLSDIEEQEIEEQEYLLSSRTATATSKNKVRVYRYIFESLLLACIVGLSLKLYATNKSHYLEVKTPIPDCKSYQPRKYHIDSLTMVQVPHKKVLFKPDPNFIDTSIFTYTNESEYLRIIERWTNLQPRKNSNIL
jgi:hypothetical protein